MPSVAFDGRPNLVVWRTIEEGAKCQRSGGDQYSL